MRLAANGSDVRLEFITRGETGVEAGEPFGAGVPGLRVWQQAASDLAAVRQLLGFFRSERDAYPTDLRAYFEHVTEAKAQRELFAAVTFETGTGDTAVVIEAIDAELRALAVEFGIDLGAAVRERDKLYGHVRDVAEKRVTNKLTRADLRAAFGAATSVVLRADFERLIRQAAEAPAAIRALLGTASQPTVPLAPAEPLLQEPLPLPANFLPRNTVVADLRSKLRVAGILFLQGAANIGKTTLARSLAAGEPNEWRWLPMAGVRGEGALLRLRGLVDHLMA